MIMTTQLAMTKYILSIDDASQSAVVLLSVMKTKIQHVVQDKKQADLSHSTSSNLISIARFRNSEES